MRYALRTGIFTFILFQGFNIGAMGITSSTAEINCFGSVIKNPSLLKVEYMGDVLDSRKILGDTVRNFVEILRAGDLGNVFTSISRMKKASYFSVFYPGLINESFIVEPGDSVNISLYDGNVTFSGNCAEKFRCEYSLMRLGNDKVLSLIYSTGHLNCKSLEQYDSLAKEAFGYLRRYKGRISDLSFDIMWGQIFNRYQTGKYWIVKKFGIDSLVGYKDPNWEEIEGGREAFEYLKKAAFYLSFLEKQFTIDSCFLLGRPFDVFVYYTYIKKKYTGLELEQLLYKSFLGNAHGGQNKNLLPCIEDAIERRYIADAKSVSKMAEIMKILPGAVAYDFSLRDTKGRTIHQHDLIGKVVLIDLWYNHCGACAELQPYMERIKKAFKNEKFYIVSIAINYFKLTRMQWIRVIQSGQYSSMDLVNLVLDPKSDADFLQHYNITASPTLILIDREGKIASQGLDPREDNGKTMIEAIKELIR
ncbi:MAG TPA: TlpA disulfide reductase family protein [Puia sp.]|jgi:thiol-disulfide isomerase/thioredoxin